MAGKDLQQARKRWYHDGGSEKGHVIADGSILAGKLQGRLLPSPDASLPAASSILSLVTDL